MLVGSLLDLLTSQYEEVLFSLDTRFSDSSKSRIAFPSGAQDCDPALLVDDDEFCPSELNG